MVPDDPCIEWWNKFKLWGSVMRTTFVIVYDTVSFIGIEFNFPEQISTANDNIGKML